MASALHRIMKTVTLKPKTTTYVRNPKREFQPQIKAQEKKEANFRCRICGTPKHMARLECAHIYSVSKNKYWKRSGTIKKYWLNDKFVSSFDNCIVLCEEHHKRIDSMAGLKHCSVKYLKSLKKHPQIVKRCTALVLNKNKWSRCRKKPRAPKGSSTKDLAELFRCRLHERGGLEETLPKNEWGQ